jgi:cytoskeletal protein RodZ
MSFLERLRQKPDSEKRFIAISVALIVTLIIAVLWLVARSAMQS